MQYRLRSGSASRWADLVTALGVRRDGRVGLRETDAIGGLAGDLMLARRSQYLAAIIATSQGSR